MNSLPPSTANHSRISGKSTGKLTGAGVTGTIAALYALPAAAGIVHFDTRWPRYSPPTPAVLPMYYGM